MRFTRFERDSEEAARSARHCSHHDGIDRDSKETVKMPSKPHSRARAIFAIYYKAKRNAPIIQSEQRTAWRTGGSGYPGVVVAIPWRRGYPVAAAVAVAVATGSVRAAARRRQGDPRTHLLATGGTWSKQERQGRRIFREVTALLKNQYTLSWTPIRTPPIPFRIT